MNQIMKYELLKNQIAFETGEILAEGTDVFEMTEDVRIKLSDRFEHGGEFEFVDVSNHWTFSYEDGVDEYEIIFAPLGTHADKFSIEEE